MREQKIREQVHALIKKYYEALPENRFIPGRTKIQYSGPVFDENEVNAVIDSLLGGWLAEGKSTIEFEEKFRKYIGAKECVVTNSGSSALLLSFAALMNASLKNPLKPGDEVITTALTFPTTLNAIILNRLTPVLVDVERDTYNINPNLIEDVISEKTRAILVVHHLGNPCKMDKIMEIVKNNNLYLIEDCCDAHGSLYGKKKVGSFGDMGCFSFYAAHAMTMGEGGAITINNLLYGPILRSLKTCGRACVCSPCRVITDPNYICQFRMGSQIKGFENFDKRALYTNIGYKLKILDLQSAFAIEQLKKLPFFIKRRTENFKLINKALKKWEKYLILPKPTPNSSPDWFAIPLTVRADAPFTKNSLVNWLEKHKIETRPLLGGNIIKHPAYKNIKYRATSLENTNFFNNHSFYIGCYPGITKEIVRYIVQVFEEFFKNL